MSPFWCRRPWLWRTVESGKPQVPTLNMDSIAKNGVRFTKGYVSGTRWQPERIAPLRASLTQQLSLDH